MEKSRQRPLTSGESEILALVQEVHGPANTADRVSFSDQDEAIIWVVDREGSMVSMVVLTHVAEWSTADGLSRDEIVSQYLIKSSERDVEEGAVSGASSAAEESGKIRHGRVLAFMILVFVFPVTVVNAIMAANVTVFTFVPGLLGAVLILAGMYFKWWRAGKLT